MCLKMHSVVGVRAGIVVDNPVLNSTHATIVSRGLELCFPGTTVTGYSLSTIAPGRPQVCPIYFTLIICYN